MIEVPRARISVIIPHYNNLDGLARCIDRLRRQTLQRDRFEIVVADNNSAGGVAAVQQIAPDVRIVRAPEQGAGPARNAGASAARGDLFAFIDSDCLAQEKWLEEGLASLQQFDYIGGRVVTTVPDNRTVTPAEAYELVFSFDCKRYIEKKKFAVTANLFVPRAIFKKVGGFRNGVSEDCDWCWRANAMGYRIGYAEKAIVFHGARREWAELARKWDRIVAETFALTKEQPGWRWRWPVRTLSTFLSPLSHALRVILSRKLLGVRSKVAGLVGLLGIRIYRTYRMISVMNRAEK
jgi:GT2 family glycosyltransferase